MSSGILHCVSQLVGLLPFDSLGKFNFRLMLWSVAVHAGWFGLTLWSKVVVFDRNSEVAKSTSLSDSIWNFQLMGHTGCISYQAYVMFSERRLMEEIYSVANSVHMNRCDQIYPVVTVMAMFLCWLTECWTGGGLEPEFAVIFGCQVYSIFVDSLIILGFCSLMTRISAKFRDMRVSVSLYRRIDYLGHSRLIELCEEANRIYDVQLLVICASIFSTLVSTSYTFHIRCDGGTEEIRQYFSELVSIAIMISFEVWLVFVLSDSCARINEDADSFNLELFNAMRAEKELCDNDAYYLYVVVRQSVEVTACGFFYIGYPLVTSLIGAACTYLVILIQFS